MQASIRTMVAQGENAHPGLEVNALLMEHLLADLEDLVVTVGS